MLLLECNCFTMLCHFLLYNEVINCMYTYIPSVLGLLPTFPTQPSRPSWSAHLSSLCFIPASHQLSVFTHGSAYMSVILSQFSSTTFSLLLKSDTPTTCCFPNHTHSHLGSFAFAPSLTCLLLCFSKWGSLTHAGLGDAGQQQLLTISLLALRPPFQTQLKSLCSLFGSFLSLQ